MSFVEEQTEIGEDHPELLPATAVLELPQQVSRKLVLKRNACGHVSRDHQPRRAAPRLDWAPPLALPLSLTVQWAGRGWTSPALLVPSVPGQTWEWAEAPDEGWGSTGRPQRRPPAGWGRDACVPCYGAHCAPTGTPSLWASRVRPQA